MKKIVVLGSTGSIGRNVLQVVGHLNKHCRENFRIVGLTANENIDLLYQQALAVRPKAVALLNEHKAELLAGRLKRTGIKVWGGREGLLAVAGLPAELAFSAMVGAAGLLPTLQAIRTGKDIALANKEPLVMAGEIVKKELKKYGGQLLPVDSEHCAIFQCLLGHVPAQVRRVVLTASGGPFFQAPLSRIKKVTVSEALAHPTWKMGKKITMDSATLMNKGLEVIEAHHLFDIPLKNIEVVIHPQSIIHSMVEFVDGATLAQMSYPDMKLPIQYALTYPRRLMSHLASLDLAQLKHLDFFRPDKNKFRCLHYAYEAAGKGRTYPAVLNAANEIAVAAFLEGRIKFLQISGLIGRVLQIHRPGSRMDLTAVLEADQWARQKTCQFIDEMRG